MSLTTLSSQHAEVAAAYDDASRCLKFLQSSFVPVEHALDLVDAVGPYNAFEPSDVRDRLRSVAELDPDARVAVGRESSPVLYVETTVTEDTMGELFDRAGGGPDEFWPVDADEVGPYWAGEDAHEFCRGEGHADTRPDDMATPSGDAPVFRAWWD